LRLENDDRCRKTKRYSRPCITFSPTIIMHTKFAVSRLQVLAPAVIGQDVTIALQQRC